MPMTTFATDLSMQPSRRAAGEMDGGAPQRFNGIGDRDR